LLRRDAVITLARIAAPQPLTVGDEVAPAIVGVACSIAVADIETSRHLPCVASCGTPFVIAELKTRAALTAAMPRADAFAQHFPITHATGIHLYVRTDTADADISSRMFAPLHGIPEDPATGSANVALIGLLARLRPEPDLRLAQNIHQGVDMGRPSVIAAVAEKTAGVVTATYVGGRCVAMMSGVIDLT
jgi:trans-2,3-dihydro-3-hydroxyanthranilate isomerase